MNDTASAIFHTLDTVNSYGLTGITYNTNGNFYNSSGSTIIATVSYYFYDGGRYVYCSYIVKNNSYNYAYGMMSGNTGSGAGAGSTATIVLNNTDYFRLNVNVNSNGMLIYPYIQIKV